MIFIMFFILFSLLIFGLILHCKLILYLRKNQYETWNILGRPSLLNNSVRNCFFINRFLFRKEYLKLRDPYLIRIANFIRNFNIFYLGLFFLCVIAMMFHIL